MNKLPASTPAGIRTKMLAVAWENCILIVHDPEARGYDEVVARNLSLAVLAELGVTIPDRLIAAIPLS